MKINFKENSFYDSLLDISMSDKNHNKLHFNFGSDGNLYLLYESKNKNLDNRAVFLINEEDEMYPFIEKLINDIKDCNVFQSDSIMKDSEMSIIERINLRSEYLSKNRELKEKGGYKRVVYDNTIKWYSDSTKIDDANSIQTTNMGGCIPIIFTLNEKDPLACFGIKINSYGSRYEPINICFMNLYNSLQEYGREKASKVRKNAGI